MAWWNALISPVAKVFEKALDVVDDLVEDKDLANKLKARLQTRMLELAHEELLTVIRGQVEIILAEAKGSWIQRNWRPLFMLMCMAILCNNYIVHPYIMLFFPGRSIELELPGWMGALLTTGMGGYIGARTIEKVKGATGSVLPQVSFGKRK